MSILRKYLALAAVVSSLGLTACGGAAPGSTLPVNGNSTTQPAAQQTEDAIDTANAVGAPLTDISTYNDAIAGPASSGFVKGAGPAANAAGSGACTNGVEFFVPDKNADANSTERIAFYDDACTQIARDAVRIVSAGAPGSEIVQRTVHLYAMNEPSTPEAVRAESVVYSNAQFDQYGYPVLSSGFDRVHTGSLTLGGVRTIDADGELSVSASSSNVSNFCSDSAGFNATGNLSANETFGWQSSNPGGTRTVNGDGSVTWSLTRTGTAFTAAIGALSIQTGAQNTACPVSTPMFTLAGGSAKGTYTIPIDATYKHGILTNLTIANAALVNGDTLNVSTNGGVAPSDPHFISGTLSSGAGTIATFNVDAFGDGSLVVKASGKVYAMIDWHVVKAAS
ncbi:MAG: hypothetical protein ABR508_06205 [Candidatus Baltobacteraceae bacterium]